MKNIKERLFIKLISCFGILVCFIYLLFLVLPFLTSGIVGGYAQDIEHIIKESTGLNAKIDGLSLETTPRLHVGVKAKNVVVKDDRSSEILNSDSAVFTLKIIPLLFKNIELGEIKADKLEISLDVKNDGTLMLLESFPTKDKNDAQMVSLPYGLKLSNSLPSIFVKQYKISILNSSRSYYAEGEDFKISDFILDKKIKVSTKGKIVLDRWLLSQYNIKVFNKIMPNLNLDDLIFPKEVSSVENTNVDNMPQKANDVFGILQAVKKNKLRVDVNADIKTSGTLKYPSQKGYFSLENFSVGVNGKSLPQSSAKLLFKGKKTEIYSKLYSSCDSKEITSINGLFSSKWLDLKVKSNAKFNNLIRLADSIAQSFGINDLKTISATGGIDADLAVKSDLKKVISSGYLKVLPSSLKYSQYNLSISDIIADISLDNNNIDIKNLSLSVMGHPLKLIGRISDKAFADLKLSGEKLSLKGLVGALGQIKILNENNINSGTISLNAVLKGALKEISPDVRISVDNINIYNKPAKITLNLANSVIKMIISKSSASGEINVNRFNANMDGAVISVPSADIVMDNKDINIINSYVLLNKSRIDVKGIVKDYLTEKLNMNISAKGRLASADVAAFIPKDVRVFFPYKGTMPVSITAVGNQKTQDICFSLIADPANYIQFADVNLLKNKQTKIYTDIKLSGNNAKLYNSGVFAGTTKIASFEGDISNFSSPKLNISVVVPQKVSFPIWGLKNSNITAVGKLILGGTLEDLKLGGNVHIDDLSVKDMAFSITNLSAKLSGHGIGGNATAEKFKFGGLVATNLSSKFSLKNYTDFYLENLSGTAFEGKVNGKFSYNIPSFKFGLDLSGKGLNSMDAVYGAVGIPKALTGTLDFSTNISSSGLSDKEIIQNLKGNFDFDIKKGRFVSIGKFENIVAAQNITSNSLLKAAISAMSTVSAIQQTDKFDSINGKMNFSNGVANIPEIRVIGPLMSYYVTGKYYILPNSANLKILGRLDSKIVSYMGVLGQLSVEKLLSYIPGLGANTIKFITKITSDPSKENISLIPELSSGSKEYKDFRVIFNGSVERASSVKSFMWLSKCDTTQMNLKKDLQDAKKAVEENINNRIKDAQTKIENTQKNIEKAVEYHKQNIEKEKKVFEQTKTDIVNIKKNAGQSASNLSKLLLNAASNANKKVQPAKSTDTKSNDAVSSETKPSTSDSDAQTPKSEAEK